MKCLVLGGGGFLGSHLSEALLTQGHSVRIFDRPNLVRFKSFQRDDEVEWIEGDFINSEHLAQAVCGCDVIYHLISTTLPSTSNANPIYDIESNVVSTLNLLTTAITNQVKKIIFVSSGGTVYGMPQEIPIRECHPTEPICSYGIGKLTIEKYLSLFHKLHGLDYCILRLSNPFGERQRLTAAQGAVTIFLDKVLRNEAIEIWGDGSVIRDYIYISDAISALIKTLNYEGSNRIFNIGSGIGRSLNDIIDSIELMCRTTVKKSYAPARSLDVPVNVLDISKAAKHLDWKPQFSFEEGLSRTAQWITHYHETKSSLI